LHFNLAGQLFRLYRVERLLGCLDVRAAEMRLGQSRFHVAERHVYQPGESADEGRIHNRNGFGTEPVREGDFVGIYRGYAAPGEHLDEFLRRLRSVQ